MSSKVETRHPSVTADRVNEWRLMRDSAEGESAIKSAGTFYLPRPSGFEGHSDQGMGAYHAYRLRAQFPEIVAPSLSAMIGLAHGKETQIELPPGLEYLVENADGDGLTLEAFHRRITRHLLTLGRYAVLVDAPETGGVPYLKGYSAETVINWDRDFWVLDESGMERDGFEWKQVKRHRVLELLDGLYTQAEYVDGELVRTLTPSGLGGASLGFIPFCAANARDLVPVVETPPLIGVARCARAMYQLSADYRWQLYMSGQETLVAINGDAPTHVGAGVVHSMMGAEGVTPDLKYVSPTCSGIEAHRQAIQDEREAAVMAGARLLEQSDQVEESGTARKLRFASESATLLSVVQVSAGLLEKSLRYAAAMQGIPEDSVVVTPPAKLMDAALSPTDAQALVASWQAGAIAYETLYENLQRGGIASAERDADAERDLMDSDDITSGDAALTRARRTEGQPGDAP